MDKHERKQSNLSRVSTYCSYLYVLVLCVGTALVGGALIFLCRRSFPEFRDTVGLANSLCFLSGVVMSSFVISWLIYTAFLCSRSSADCHEKKKEAAEDKFTSLRIVSGRICFFLLLLTALSELTCLGFLWWTSFSLSDKFTVEEDCFCVRTNFGQVTPNILFTDGFDVNCPVSRDINCVAIYGDLDVFLSSNITGSNLQLTLKNCQRLDQFDELDSDCLSYTGFWFLFKMLRIVLPILAVMKLPFLLMNCLEVLSNNLTENVYAEPEFRVPEVRSPLSLMSPPRARAKPGKVENSPYFGLRLAPLGEEEARQSSVVTTGRVVPVGKMNVVGFLARQEAVRTPSKAEDDLPDEMDSVFKSNSPQSSIEDCVISTPIQRGMKSPSFDLSKVIQPVFQCPDREEYHYPPPVPTSTFRSALPAVIRHQLDTQPEMSGEDNLFSTQTHQQPLDVSTLPRSLRGGSLPDPEVPPRLELGRSKRFSLSRPSARPPKPPTVPNVDEIVRTARSKSVTSKIDWTKMP